MGDGIEAILDEITPREKTVSIRTRGDLDARIEELEAEIKANAASAALADPDQEARAREVADLIERSPARQFTVQAIGQRRWSDLLAKHPPSDEQRRQFFDHDPATFPYAAVAASVSEPAMTVDQACELADRLSLGQWLKLWSAVLEVNVGGESVPKSETASAVLRRSEQSSTTADPEGSLAQSS